MSNIFDRFDKELDLDLINEELANPPQEKKEVPVGEYDVKIDKLEARENNKGLPQVFVQFRIIDGDYKNQCLFYGQNINMAFQIRLANEFLSTLDAGEVKFENYAKYAETLMDIAEKTANFEYKLEYGLNEKGFKTFKILEVYEKEV